MLKQALFDCRDYLVLCKYLEINSERGALLMNDIVNEIRDEVL